MVSSNTSDDTHPDFSGVDISLSFFAAGDFIGVLVSTGSVILSGNDTKLKSSENYSLSLSKLSITTP